MTNDSMYRQRIENSRTLLTVTQIAKDYGYSGHAFNEMLHKLGVQYKQNGQWLLYSKYQACGYVHSETLLIARSNGSDDAKQHTMWTQKGRLFIYDLLAERGVLPIIERA